MIIEVLFLNQYLLNLIVGILHHNKHLHKMIGVPHSNLHLVGILFLSLPKIMVGVRALNNHQHQDHRNPIGSKKLRCTQRN
ncbi:hypothetical protein C1646_706822 [Rhizophagus diaphanus]|nr:hypothetical protein C1646_706822 [Rhizophagus diaphanus] [Rhizophagus sp. MUCL 43196]